MTYLLSQRFTKATFTMPTSCIVFGCSARWIRSEDDDQPRTLFFTIPRDPERRERWATAINRKGWTPKDHHRVCSRHFIEGRPSRNPLHPDYVPSLHMGGEKGGRSISQGERKLARYERTVERRQRGNAALRARNLPPEDHRNYVEFGLGDQQPKEWKRDQQVSFEPVDASVQTDVRCAHVADRIEQRERENAQLQEKLEEMSSSRIFGLHLIENNDRKTKFYTGLPTFATFEALFTYLESEARTMTSGTAKTQA